MGSYGVKRVCSQYLFKAFFILLSFSPAYAEVADNNQKAVTLVTDHWQPFYGPKLHNGGYIIEICKAAFAASGYQLNIKFMPWKRATKAVKSEIYDGLLGAYYTSERAKYLYYTQALAEEKTSLIALKSRSFNYRKRADLYGYTIGVMRAAVNDSEFDKDLRLNFSYANDASHNLRKLITGRVDFIVTGEAHLSYLVKHNHSDNLAISMSQLEVFKPPLKVNPIYITIRKARKNSANIIAAFNRGISIIKQNGKYTQIKNKHLSSLFLPTKSDPLLDFFQGINIVAR